MLIGLVLLLVALVVLVLVPGTGESMTRVVTGFVRGNPVAVTLASIGDGFELEQSAAVDFLAMRRAAAAEGVTLKVNTAFRDNDWQARLYAAFVAGTGNLAARPGWSTHQAGKSVDLSTDGQGRASSVYRWLATHASTYNFTNDVASEPWHWTHG